MAGLAPNAESRAAMGATYVANLAWAAERAAAANVDVLIEPINTRDIPGYFLNRQDEAHAIVQEVGAPNLKVQMDLYHCQIVEGDLAMKLKAFLPTGRVGHLQIAGVPERHEPDLGEIHHPYLFALIDALGWRGHIGCEYRPAGATSAGLGWFERHRQHQETSTWPAGLQRAHGVRRSSKTSSSFVSLLSESKQRARQRHVAAKPNPLRAHGRRREPVVGKAREEAADRDTAFEAREPHAATKVSDDSVPKCSACASCCLNAVVATETITFDTIAHADRFAPLVTAGPVAYVTEGQERPPRTFLA